MQSLEEPKETEKTEEEEVKPQTIIIPTGSLGDISETRVQAFQ